LGLDPTPTPTPTPTPFLNPLILKYKIFIILNLFFNLLLNMKNLKLL